jgi:hypothetical protein
MTEVVESLLVDLLSWLALAPRAYGEVMEAWRTSCPRLAIWEAALEGRYVARLSPEYGLAKVSVTEAGRAFLAARGGVGD